MARGMLRLSVMKPDKPIDKSRKAGKEANQGEGDRTSARSYDRHVREFVAGGNVESAARAAGDYVERAPGDAARAEQRARKGPLPTKISLDELVAKGHTMIARVEKLVRRVAGRLGRRPN
jgi:hypothetical protein